MCIERVREREVVASIVTDVLRRSGARGRGPCAYPLMFSSLIVIIVQSVGYRGFSHIWVSTLTLCVPSLAYFIFCFSVHNRTTRLWPSEAKQIVFLSRNCCRHHFATSFLDLVDRLHCALTRLTLHGHGAYLPPCTTSFCRCACSLTHPRGSPLPGASTVSRKRTAYSPGYTQQFGTPRTSTPNPRDRPGPSRFPRCSHRWKLRSRICP